MLRSEVCPPELDLVQPISDARRGIHIPATSIGKFRGSFIKFEAFDVQEFNNMTLFQFHRSDSVPFLMIYIPVLPAILSRGNPILSQ
jgi:hypothetical protein